jgi:hypothetical protein
VIALIVGLWPRDAAGHYPAPAYLCALAAIIALQVVALPWFIRPQIIAGASSAASRS